METSPDEDAASNPLIWPMAPPDVSWLLVVQAASILVAAAGNILVAVLILRSKCLRTEPAYKFICSLCMADILVSVVAQPMCVVRLVYGHDVNEQLEQVLFFSTWGFCGSSAFGVVIVTIERLVYIHYPLHYRSIITSHRTYLMIAIQWVCGLSFGGLPLLNPAQTLPAAIAALITLNVMILVLAVAYFKIYKASRRHRRTIKFMQSTMGLPQPSRQNHATVTIVLIVLAFTLCWYPHILANFLWSYCKQPSTEIWRQIWYWLLALGYGNSTINVLIYGLKNKTLLKEAKALLGLRRRQPEPPRQRSSTLTELINHQTQNPTSPDVQGS